MPSGKHTWSQTAASNATADSAISWPEGMPPSAVNDSARAEMAVEAKWPADNSGALTTAGTSTAFTLTTNTVFTTLALLSGQKLCVKFNATNGAAATLNVDTLGAKALQTVSGTAIPTGLILANSIWDVTYDNSIPAFIVHGIPTVLPATGFTGAITAADGSASAPEYSFSADTNTGMYRIGADNIGFAANGAKVLDMTTSGLAVTGALSATGALSGGTGTIGGNNIITTANVADQAAEEAASSISVYTSPGRQQFHPSAAKAWAFVTISGGAPSLTANYNCTSVTDNGVGNTTVNFTAAFSSANYCAVASMLNTTLNQGYMIEVTAITTGGVQVRTGSLGVSGANTTFAAADISFFVAAYGDQ